MIMETMPSGGKNVHLKKLVTGVLVVTMAFGMASAGVSASAETSYQAAAAALDKTIYSGDDLGAEYTPEYTEFRVWAPNADAVKTKLYETGSDSERNAKVISEESMTLDKETGVWYCKIFGNLKNKYYAYIVKRGDSETETADIYAKGAGVNGDRSMVVDLGSTNPEGWDKDKHVTVSNPTDAKVWEVSVRDFSVSATSGVTEKNRGKYLAFTETDTTVNGAEGNPSTCVDYLKKLGVNYVQIMPFFDFGSIDESKPLEDQYNWGYDPKNYNVPEGSFSSDPYNGEVRIKECKQMIKALHDAGIGVIMDVVYNHTYSVKDSFFNLTVPDYYYRKNSDGSWSDGSGCGNDTASEHKMFRKYMVDSVTYWAKEYHIDGFRFDLMGLHDVDTMNEIRASLDKLENGEKILMYGEAWNLSTNADEGTKLAIQGNMKDLNERIGAFDDTVRDAVKGSSFSIADQGFIQSGSKRGNLKIGIAGQADPVTGWAKAASQCVTYASCHDNYTLYDKLVASVKGSDGDFRKRYNDLVAMNKLSAAIIYTSQGIPFILSGEEFARTKDGNGNSYNSNDTENELVWSNVSYYGDLTEYYRGLMQIRDHFAAFRDATSVSAQNIQYLEDVPDGVTAYVLPNTESGKWNSVCVLLNGSGEDKEISLKGDSIPKDWVILADGETAGLRNLGSVGDKVKVAKNSAVILVDKEGYEAAGIKAEEGAVVVNYYDRATSEVFASKVVTGKIGDSYSIEADSDISMNYNINGIDGNTNGTFRDGVDHVRYYCDAYSGTYSKITFKFVDAVNEGVLADSVVMSNREGQQYTTTSIPTVSGYFLDMDKLPSNGAGLFTDADQEVVYKYNRITEDQADVCRVNVIYMDASGKILDTITTEGDENTEYSAEEKSFSGMEVIQSPHNAKGTFVKGEINVLYVYAGNDSAMVPYIITFVTIAGVLLLAGGVFLFSTLRSKKLHKDQLDIEE